MIYQPGIDLVAIRRGWVFIVAAAGAAALFAAVLAVWWKTATEDSWPTAADAPRSGVE